MKEKEPEKFKLTEDMNLDQTNKQSNFIHYRSSTFYIKYGIGYKNVRIVYRFTQPLWLAKFNNYNTNQKTTTKTEFEKHFHKLLNISFYGKKRDERRQR